MSVARVLAAVLAAASAAPVQAQAQADAAPGQPPAAARPRVDRWRLSAGTGVLGAVEFADAFAGGILRGFGGYGTVQEDRFQIGVRVDRDVGRASFGLGYTLQHWRDALYFGGTRAGAVDSTVHLLLADARVRWLTASWVDLYSGGGLGFGMWTQEGDVGGVRLSATEPLLAFQLRLLGVDAGGERFRVYAELGAGFEGTLLAGVGWRF